MIKKIFALLTFCLIGCACAEQKQTVCCSGDEENTPNAVAANELLTFIKLFGAKVDARKGDLKLGQPFVKSFIPVETLTNEKFNEGVLRSAYKSQKTTVFPIVQGENVVGSIEVSENEGKWSLVALGSDDDATKLAFKRRSNNCLGDIRIVSIPAMNLIMISSETRLSIHVYPIGDYPAYGLKNGQDYNAKDIWPKLREAAKTMNFSEPG